MDYSVWAHSPPAEGLAQITARHPFDKWRNRTSAKRFVHPTMGERAAAADPRDHRRSRRAGPSSGHAERRQPARVQRVELDRAKPEPIIGIASVVDGGSIDVHGQRIRFNGIDAPESR
ncbi:hypothetical protein [Mesorhizobium sp. M0047]|uniref:hypothetical protein n=1 Tax=Mesorhizobium sp. M0047 TaxID=2956859 RepID=UPI0033372483